MQINVSSCLNFRTTWLLVIQIVSEVDKHLPTWKQNLNTTCLQRYLELQAQQN